nr:uncharacterized protein LOC124814781 [Hydra vulgaris]
MHSSEREILILYIGWENGWENECNFSFIKRLMNTDKITNNVILILLKVFPSKTLFSFISFILPIEFNLPNIEDFEKICIKTSAQVKEWSISLALNGCKNMAYYFNNLRTEQLSMSIRLLSLEVYSTSVVPRSTSILVNKWNGILIYISNWCKNII